MSLDRRLRDEFEQEATGIEPQVARRLESVERRARGRRNQVPSVLVLGVLIIGIVVVLRVAGPSPETAPGVGGDTGTPQSTLGATPSDSAAYDAIAGAYSVTLDDAVAAVKSDGVEGRWTMELRPSGELDLSPPPNFRLGGLPPSGVAFSLSGDRFRTNLYFNEACNSAGTYTWHLAAGALTFAVVDDSCSVRSSLLTSKPWTAAP